MHYEHSCRAMLLIVHFVRKRVAEQRSKPNAPSHCLAIPAPRLNHRSTREDHEPIVIETLGIRPSRTRTIVIADLRSLRLAKLILIRATSFVRRFPSLDGANANQDVVLMCEVMAEAAYVGHHKKKIAFIFRPCAISPMSCGRQGLVVRYTKIDDADNGALSQAS